MRVVYTVLAVISCLGLSAQTTRNTAQNGPWSSPSTWQNGIPQQGDNVTINHNVVYDIGLDVISGLANPSGNTTVNVLTINSGSLTIDGKLLALEYNLNMNGGFIEVIGGGGLFINPFQNTSINGAIIITDGAMAFNNLPGFTINSNGSIEVKENGVLIGTSLGNFNLQVNGTITLRKGARVVGGGLGNYTITVNSSGSVLFEHGAQYYQSANVNFNGNNQRVTWEVNFRPDIMGWRQMCSPVFNAKLSQLQDDMPLYFSNPLQANVYYWDANVGVGNLAQGWKFATSPNAPLDATRAYSIYAGPPNFPFFNGGKLTIKGFPEPVDTYDYLVSNTDDPNGTPGSSRDRGWNLLPNPFATSLNVSKMVKDNNFPSSYKAAHVWDTYRKQYLAILGDGVSNEISHTSNDAVITDEKYIMPFQAFWIKMQPNNPATANFTIKPSFRGIAPGVINHFKTANINFLIPVQVWNLADSTVDQMIVNVDTAGTQGFEPDRDAYKLNSLETNVPSLYTVSSDTSLTPLSIQTLQVVNEIIPVHFTSVSPGDYAIRLGATVQGMSQVDLLDLKTNTTHNLLQGPYTFTHDLAFGAHRFNLILGGNSIAAPEYASQEPWAWYQTVERWQVDLPAGNWTMELFDLGGRLVHKSAVEGKVGGDKADYDLPHGVYTARFSQGGTARVFKLIL